MKLNVARRIAKGWIEHRATLWAEEALEELLETSHDDAWPVIFEILADPLSDEILLSLAVGPIEDILTSHADLYVEMLNQKLPLLPQLKRCLIMGINITGPNSEQVKNLVGELRKEAIRDGTHPAL